MADREREKMVYLRYMDADVGSDTSERDGGGKKPRERGGVMDFRGSNITNGGFRLNR